MSDWITRGCSIDGCGVRIKEPLAHHDPMPICRWHEAGQAYILRAIKVRLDAGPIIAREEFGRDLYDAINLMGAMRQEEANAAMYERKQLPGRAREAIARAKELSAQLQTILANNTLDAADIKRLLVMT